MQAAIFISALIPSISVLANTAENAHPVFTPPPPVVSSGSMLQIIFSLLLVLAAILIVAWLLKRMNVTQHSTGNVLKVVGGIAIGQRERIMLIEVKDTWLVVGVGQGQIHTLHTLPKQESPNADNTDTSSPNSENKFAKMLSTVIHRQSSVKKRNAS